MDVIGCRIELLGELRIVHGEHIIHRFRTQKAAGLIAYLACFWRQVHPRERIADLFWPDKDPEAGRQNLTTILTSLRRQLEAAGLSAQEVLVSDRQTIYLNPVCVATDAEEFDRLLLSAAKEQGPIRKAAHLAAAIALYRAEPLPGRYEDWARDLQVRYAERYADALDQYSAALEALGRPESALEAAQRAMRADPYREAPRGVQMRAYAALGRPSAALEAYQHYERLLNEEMEMAPSRAMQALAECLRRDPTSFERSASSVPTPETASADLAVSALPVNTNEKSIGAQPALPPVRLTLPLQLTRFFGREQEMADLQALLCPTPEEEFVRPRSRLITLTGPGGAGKTRLSIETASRVAAQFQGRVWFVDLAHLPGPELLPMALLNALKLPPAGPTRDAFQILEQALGSEKCLLVLDNFEQLLSHPSQEPDSRSAKPNGQDYIRLLLERADGLTCLITSRQSLQIGGEQEFPVPPLSKPPDLRADPDALSRNASIALYTDRAILAKPDFALTQSNASAVAELCRRLDGMPLAIEMAAAWARTLSPGKVLERMKRQLDLLVSRRRDLPSRHQSMRATIEWSYDLLALPQQRFLAHLSVFRGGWTLEAAEALCDTGEDPALERIAELQERSLIVAETNGEKTRYRLQEIVREFSAERLEVSGERAEIQRKHFHFFLQLAETLGADAGQADRMLQLEEEHDNLRAALEWSLNAEEEKGRKGTGEQEFSASVSSCPLVPFSPSPPLKLCRALLAFWRTRGYLAEGREWCARTLGTAEGQARTQERAEVVNGAGMIANLQGDYIAATSYHQESLSLYRELGNRSGISAALNGLGNVASHRSDSAAARAYYEESLTIRREMGDRSGIGAALHNLGTVARNQGDNASAQAYYAESLILFREAGNKPFLANALSGLGNVASSRDDHAGALAYYAEALILYRELGNTKGIADALVYLGNTAYNRGDAVSAQAYYEESLPIYREIGDRSGLGISLNCLGDVALKQGAFDAARANYIESAIHFREIGHRRFLANSLNGLGNVLLTQGDMGSARIYYAESLTLQSEIGDRHGISFSLEALADIAAHQRRWEQAAILWGAADALRIAMGLPGLDTDRAVSSSKIAEVRSGYGEEPFWKGWETGSALMLEQMVQYALKPDTLLDAFRGSSS